MTDIRDTDTRDTDIRDTDIRDRRATPKHVSRRFVDPAQTTGYVLLSASLDGHADPDGTGRQELIGALKASAARLRRNLFANVGVLTARRFTSGNAYDVAVLLQAPTVEAAQWLTADPAFGDLRRTVASSAVDSHVAVIHNVRRSHCEYGVQTRRLYLLMGYRGYDDREVIPAWGWTHRREMLADMAFSPALRRFRYDGESTRFVLYGLA
ncbi:MAG TPA: hypothetical protein VF657_19155 [Actinoplanes sp.]|jgi:hypothetical protein